MPAYGVYISSFETVHHLESKISGKLKHHINEIDIFKAMFPGGSITGAPKESSMQIIDRLENYNREIYTGSIGHIDNNGDMHFNIAIRTMVAKKILSNTLLEEVLFGIQILKKNGKKLS